MKSHGKKIHTTFYSKGKQLNVKGIKPIIIIYVSMDNLNKNSDQVKNEFPVSSHSHSSFSPFLDPAGQSLTLT